MNTRNTEIKSQDLNRIYHLLLARLSELTDDQLADLSNAVDQHLFDRDNKSGKYDTYWNEYDEVGDQRDDSCDWDYDNDI